MSPGCRSPREMRAPLWSCPHVSRGTGMPARRETYQTNPEQSKPRGVVPPQTYGEPKNFEASATICQPVSALRYGDGVGGAGSRGTPTAAPCDGGMGVAVGGTVVAVGGNGVAVATAEARVESRRTAERVDPGITSCSPG